MYLSRRNKIIIIAVIVLLIILLVLLLLMRGFKGKQEAAVVVVPDVVEIVEPIDDGPVEMIPVEPVEIESVSVEVLAKSFAERYGSYSNESDFQNLRDLEPLMTGQMQTEVNALIARTEVGENYYGITTQALSVDVLELEEDLGYALVEVLTQREEAIGSPQNTEVIYQTISLELTKPGTVWMINAATWE